MRGGRASRPLTVVMYHYVRPIRGSRYPGVKGLEVDVFMDQLRYLAKHYTPVKMEDVVATLRGDAQLPPNAALLTFDDGYRDHREFVLPALQTMGLQGSFFVPAMAVRQARMLDVNKLHFILASVPDMRVVVEEVEREILTAGQRWELPPVEELRARLLIATRFDGAEVAYVKRLLQRVLPAALRAAILTKLFSRFVTSDEAAFATELYLRRDDISDMVAADMHIGGHGNTHSWMGSLTAEQQVTEISESRKFLRWAGVPEGVFSFCYPYGDYNDETLGILQTSGCSVAFTTKVEVATIPGSAALEIPRLDTNDLPPVGHAFASASAGPPFRDEST